MFTLTCVVLTLTMVGGVVIGFRRYRSIVAYYNYDRSADYIYPPFTDCEIIDVDVDEEGCLVPAMPGSCTVLLELSVSCSFPLLEGFPRIRFSSGEFSFQQAFEPGAAGKRYLNLTPLVDRYSASPLRVEMKGRHAAWKKQSGRLLLFRNERLQGKKILVVAPHPDDAEIAAFGFGTCGNTSVVTLTAGDGGRASYFSLIEDRRETYQLKAELRSLESIQMPLLAGHPPGQSMNLGYFDCTLATMHADPTTPVASATTGVDDVMVFRRGSLLTPPHDLRREATWNNLVADLRNVIEATTPDIVVVPHPVLDCHPDHRFTFLATLQAIRASGHRECSFFLYAVHGELSQTYPFGGSDSIVSLPPWFSPDLPLEGLYSHTLTSSMRVRKLIALDAMSDLRPVPLFYEAAGPVARLEEFVSLQFKRNQDFDRNFGKKRARFNELFFVHSLAGAEAFEAYFTREHANR